jgi:hypothetical protein
VILEKYRNSEKQINRIQAEIISVLTEALK